MSRSARLNHALRDWMDVAMHRLNRDWSDRVKASGLSMRRFNILMQLYPHGRCGISDISERCGISAAAASQHVENLVQAGLIERTETPEDRRVRQIELSAKARRLLEKGTEVRHHWIDRLEASLGEKEREKLASALATITEAARKLDLP